MSLILEKSFHYKSGNNGRKILNTEPQVSAAEAGKIPRISRLMALALKFDKMLKNGEVVNYADLARIGGVSDAYITQIMNLLNLAPAIQEELLFLPRVITGWSPVKLKDVQKLARVKEWREQTIAWREITACP